MTVETETMQSGQLVFKRRELEGLCVLLEEAESFPFAPSLSTFEEESLPFPQSHRRHQLPEKRAQLGAPCLTLSHSQSPLRDV